MFVLRIVTLVVSLIGLFLFAAGARGEAASVAVTVGVSSAPQIVTFDSYPPETSLSGIQDFVGVSIAEAFNGQTVIGGSGSTFESFTGLPLSPLTLQVPAVDDGLYARIIPQTGTIGIAGMADGLTNDDLGEGVMSILFDSDQTEVGLRVIGASGGQVQFDFFARDGSLVDTVVVTVPGIPGYSSYEDYTFTGGPFAGISMSNTDPYGAGIDDLRFSLPIPPSPAEQIAALISYVEALNLHNGISNALDSKLDAALKALDDVQEGNDAAAINALQAFINAVQAQSGKEIDTADADALIAAAQAIIDLLSGT